MAGGGETEVVEKSAGGGLCVSDEELAGFDPDFSVRAGDDF